MKIIHFILRDVNIKKVFYEKEINESIENMYNLFDEWNNSSLTPLLTFEEEIKTQITPDRRFREIILGTNTFKIFKINDSINKKPFELFLKYVKIYIESERDKILEKFKLKTIYYYYT